LRPPYTVITALPLRWEPAFTQDHFFVSPSNQYAFHWIMQWPWPFPHVWIFGPQGCGKTHLATLWAGKHQAHWIAPHDLPIMDPQACWIIDWDSLDLEKIDQSQLYGFLMHVQESQTRCLWISRRSAAAWDGPLADVTSRIRAMVSLEIRAPDDLLLGKILEKSLLDIGWKISAKLIDFLVRRMPRSFSSVADLTQLVHQHAWKYPGLSAQRLKSLLRSIEMAEDRALNMEKIVFETDPKNL
jgi:chromosomal replication initiation ATPase DnaA